MIYGETLNVCSIILLQVYLPCGHSAQFVEPMNFLSIHIHLVLLIFSVDEMQNFYHQFISKFEELLNWMFNVCLMYM